MDFFVKYGADILAMIVALCGTGTSVFMFIRSIRLNRSIRLTQDNTMQQITITQNGIVEAFKRAKIPNELKISISNQVNKVLEDWSAKFLTMFEEHERIRTELAIANTKILAYTAAYNKLTDEEKAKIDETIKQITDKDKIIEV